jgi:voltage-gated potassium channel
VLAKHKSSVLLILLLHCAKIRYQMPSTLDQRKEKLHEIIFEADTPAGKAFDVALMVLIVLSVLVVLLESIKAQAAKYEQLFHALEWMFTICFTIEYLLRLYCVYKPKKYALSFFGIVDLLSIIPTYLSLLIAGTQYLAVIRALRLLRVFRIFKLVKFLNEGNIIVRALLKSRAKIAVFMLFILLLVTILGSVMYLAEADYNEQFDSIPRSIYWAIVTLTTVGYGDISPVTTIGQFLASFIMLLGYAVLAVPTGIVSAEIIRGDMAHLRISTNTQACRYCSKEGHDDDATNCKYCGEILNEE